VSARQLETAAAILNPVLDQVVFLGGATIHLWLTEPGAPPARATDDVDVICEVATRAEYYRLGSQLRERGLTEAINDPVICRWTSADPPLVLDVMPTNPDILGFANRWYEEAITTATTIALDTGAQIRATTPVPLVATKLCAWNGRGNSDVLLSHDIHDVLTLIDGRPELLSEINAARPELRTYVQHELEQLQTDPYFDYAVDSVTTAYGPVGAKRADILRHRLRQLRSS
jgi:predicted nucleotidyltransferase